MDRDTPNENEREKKKRKQLKAELARLDARSKRRQAEIKRDSDRRWAIDLELRRLDLMPLVGVPAGVMLRYRGFDHRLPDDCTGTLTKVARKRAHVDFGEHGKWTVPVDDLIATARQSERGYTMRLGSAA